MKITKARKTGRTFGGNYITTREGKTYWKGDANRFAGETAADKRKRKEREAAAEAARPKHFFEPNDMMPKMSLLEALLGLAAGSALIAVLLCVGVAAGLFYTMMAIWPQFLLLLAGAFAQGEIVTAAVFTGEVVFLLCYWIRCMHTVRATRRPVAKRFALLCVACMAVPFLLLDLLTSGVSGLSDLPGRLLYCVGLTLLPTVILCFAEYKAQGGERPLQRIARILCGRNAARRRIFKLLGVSGMVFGLLMTPLLLLGGSILTGILSVAAFWMAGIFFLLVGVKGKQ